MIKKINLRFAYTFITFGINIHVVRVINVYEKRRFIFLIVDVIFYVNDNYGSI